MSRTPHCDNCEREAPPYDQCRDEGWLMIDLLPSCLYNTFVCPDCLGLNSNLTREDIRYRI